MRQMIVGAVLAASLGLGFVATSAAVSPAGAQTVIVGPDGVRVRPDDRRDYDRRDRRDRRDVSAREAEDIARRNGVGRVFRVDRRRGDWVVVGSNRRGPGDLEVRIDSRSGRVVAVDRLRGRR
ncbi:PepSY domain-containing protein [Terrihabitans sp. B22-R8]|uniref:PepSY domain-containing protein n=1 Tax=Terrihabitans sp. B22-R8 TaxID=3425128 RepID=UPI00403D45D1